MDKLPIGLLKKEYNYFANNTPPKIEVRVAVINETELDGFVEEKILKLVEKEFANLKRLYMEDKNGDFKIFVGFCETVNEMKLEGLFDG